MNYLKAIFWEYPQFANEDNLKKYLHENNRKSGYLWVLKRFLEHGRVVDTLAYFNIDEISKLLPELKLSSYTAKKYKRIIEVYGTSNRK